MQKKLTIDEKRELAKDKTKTTPAVRNLGNGKSHTITEAEIDVMGETELDATLQNILQRRLVGNRASYPNVESLEAKVTEYWQSVASQRKAGYDVIPDIEHFCSFIGVSRATVNAWKRTNYNGFANTLEQVWNDIAMVKNQLAMKGEIPQLVWVTMMNNNHGYTQQSKLEVQNTSQDVIPSAENLIEQIRNLPSLDLKDENNN